MDRGIAANLGGNGVNVSLEAMLRASTEEVSEIRIAQDVSADSFMKSVTDDAVNPFARELKTKLKDMKDRDKEIKKGEAAAGVKEAIIPAAKIEETAERFQRKNQELQARMLLGLRESINPRDGRDEILRKVSLFYGDPALADEALEFLEETTTGDLKKEVMAARAELNDKFGREIAAGRNIGAKAREFAEKGLGTPTGLRDLYRDITHNPKDAATLFKDLSDKFPYKDLKEVIKFMFHSLGTDLRSKGPSIPKALLQRLMTETRALQAIMGVYRFFMGRMRLIQKLFTSNGLNMPSELTFELLAKQFMGLVNERYPTPDKILDGAKRLGIEDWLLAKIIVLTQMRDAIREMAINQIYKSLQHRDDLLAAMIECLENLEDQLDELMEKEEEEKEEDEDYDYDDDK